MTAWRQFCKSNQVTWRYWFKQQTSYMLQRQYLESPARWLSLNWLQSNCVKPWMVLHQVKYVSNNHFHFGKCLTLQENNIYSVDKSFINFFWCNCLFGHPFLYTEHKTRVYAAIVEMLRWFAGHQIRNVAVSSFGLYTFINGVWLNLIHDGD